MSSTIPHLKLFVKAGSTGLSYGVCLTSQKVFMIIALKAKSRHFSYSVHTVDLAKSTKEFQEAELKNLPAIIFQEQKLDNPMAIIQFLDNNFLEVDLSFDDILAEKACRELYAKFCFYMKAVSKDAYGLSGELERLDKHFTSRGSSKGPFICGNRMTYLDCDLLPKLQQIRVAGKAIKDFDIPSNLYGVWSYLKTAYSNETFQHTCISDEEIILHWMEKVGIDSTASKPTKTKSDLLNATVPAYSFVTPISDTIAEKEPASEMIQKVDVSTEKIFGADAADTNVKVQVESSTKTDVKVTDSLPTKSEVVIDVQLGEKNDLAEEVKKQELVPVKQFLIDETENLNGGVIKMQQADHCKVLDDLLEELQTMII